MIGVKWAKLPGTAIMIGTAARNFAHALGPRGRVGNAAVRRAALFDLVAASPTLRDRPI
jgi:hypothetical protein